MVVFLFTLIFITSDLSAEAVFIKDGSIITGTIKSETDKSFTIETATEIIIIPRDTVLRLQYSKDYMNKKYILMDDGRTIPGFIVYEDEKSYYVRDELYSNHEKLIAKDDVQSISKAITRSGNKPVPDIFPVGSIFIKTGYIPELFSAVEIEPGIKVDSDSYTHIIDIQTYGYAAAFEFNLNIDYCIISASIEYQYIIVNGGMFHTGLNKYYSYNEHINHIVQPAINIKYEIPYNISDGKFFAGIGSAIKYIAGNPVITLAQLDNYNREWAYKYDLYGSVSLGYIIKINSFFYTLEGRLDYNLTNNIFSKVNRSDGRVITINVEKSYNAGFYAGMGYQIF